MRRIILVVAILFLGCTDAGIGKLTSLGDSALIRCYSGGHVVFKGISTGKVTSEKNSDGYYFKNANTGRMTEVSGNCVIVYGASK